MPSRARAPVKRGKGLHPKRLVLAQLQKTNDPTWWRNSAVRVEIVPARSNLEPGRGDDAQVCLWKSLGRGQFRVGYDPTFRRRDGRAHG